MKLKEIRKQKNITAQSLAKLINKSIANYYKKENGQIKLTVNEMLILSKNVDIPVEELFFTD